MASRHSSSVGNRSAGALQSARSMAVARRPEVCSRTGSMDGTKSMACRAITATALRPVKGVEEEAAFLP